MFHKRTAERFNQRKAAKGGAKSVVVALGDAFAWDNGCVPDLDILWKDIVHVVNYELRHVLSSCMCGQ